MGKLIKLHISNNIRSKNFILSDGFLHSHVTFLVCMEYGRMSIVFECSGMIFLLSLFVSVRNRDVLSALQLGLIFLLFVFRKLNFRTSDFTEWVRWLSDLLRNDSYRIQYLSLPSIWFENYDTILTSIVLPTDYKQKHCHFFTNGKTTTESLESLSRLWKLP